MIVVGGHYREICVSPQNDVIFGSGGRAAYAIADADVEVDWHYYCPELLQRFARIALPSPQLRHHPRTSDDLISFSYFHPLSEPLYWPKRLPKNADIIVEGANVLRFGIMEGDAIVHGDKVVFDPQNPIEPVPFNANGSTAKSLAIVLNAKEVRALGNDEDESKAALHIQRSENAEVVLVKSGLQGCKVYVDGSLSTMVPPYRTDRIYKIGSGDIFSAAFAYHWAEKGKNPEEAADAASRCAACYCNSRVPKVLLDDEAKALEPIIINEEEVKVYIAAPFFTMADLWLLEQVRNSLDRLGVSFFSPYHDAGLHRNNEDDLENQKEMERHVEADLNGLGECKAVLAILDGCDPGTIFEVGWAVRNEIPVVALSQNPKPSAQTLMIQGSKNCSITSDFASAIYQVAWAAWTG